MADMREVCEKVETIMADNYPESVKNIGILSQIAKGIAILGPTDGVSSDLTIISGASVEMVKTSKGILDAALVDIHHAIGFVGLAMLGCYWSGYQRAMKDMGCDGKANLL